MKTYISFFYYFLIIVQQDVYIRIQFPTVTLGYCAMRNEQLCKCRVLVQLLGILGKRENINKKTCLKMFYMCKYMKCIIYSAYINVLGK